MSILGGEYYEWTTMAWLLVGEGGLTKWYRSAALDPKLWARSHPCGSGSASPEKLWALLALSCALINCWFANFSLYSAAPVPLSYEKLDGTWHAEVVIWMVSPLCIIFLRPYPPKPWPTYFILVDSSWCMLSRLPLAFQLGLFPTILFCPYCSSMI